MKVLDLIRWIKALVPGTYYPFAFPTTSADVCAIVTLHSGGPRDSDTGVSRPAFQVLVRGAARDFQETEARALAIYFAIANKLEQQIGESSVVQVTTNDSVPYFIGIDENERPIFTMNFTAVVRP